MARQSSDYAVKASYVARFDNEGNKLCVMHGCPNRLKGRQERWCSQACVSSAMATYEWSVCRKVILKRDGFKCKLCGHTGWDRDYEVDHIIPLVEGGKLCDQTNLRVLCDICHKKQTAALAKRLAAKRKTERERLHNDKCMRDMAWLLEISPK